MSDFKKDKFSFIELTMNSNGKQSGSGFIGVITGLIASAAFIAGIIGWYLGNSFIIEYFDQVIKFGGLSALLLGVRKASAIFAKPENGVETPASKPKPAITPTDEKG